MNENQTTLIEILDPQAGRIREEVIQAQPTPDTQPKWLESKGRRMTLIEAATTYSSTFPQLMMADLKTRFYATYASVPMTFTQWVMDERSNKKDENYLFDSPIGVAPIVPEGVDYPRVEMDLDRVVQVTNDKRGFIIPVTREAIFFDRYNMLVQLTQGRARSMAQTKEQTAYGIITNTANYTRTTAAGDNDIGNNYGTTQFSASGLETAFSTLMTMKDRKSAMRLRVTPNLFIGGVGLMWAAKKLFLSPNLEGMGDKDATVTYGGGSANPFRGAVTTILITPEIGRYEWVLMQSGMAVVHQQVWDLDMIQSTPTSEGWFQRDELEYKVSEFWGQGMIDDRFAYFSNDTSGPTID